MPSKSKAQFGLMGRLYTQGDIDRKTLEEFNKGVHPKELPGHVKKTRKKKTKKKKR
jgi:hypothetical protein